MTLVPNYQVIPMLLLSLTLILAGHVPQAPETPSSLFDELQTAGAASGFLSALEESGMRAELEALGPLTILAPTDDAFGALPSETIAQLFLPESREALRQILGTHILAGPLSATDLVGRDVTTLAGTSVCAAITNGALTVSGAPMQANDLRAGGSTVHLMARVIMPLADAPSPTGRIATRALRTAEGLEPRARAALFELAVTAIQQIDPSSNLAFAALHAPDEAQALKLAEQLLQSLASGMDGNTSPREPGPDATLLVSFNETPEEPDWFTLNDDVMGGISTSSFERREPGVGVFTGTLSLENNGGFASIRSSLADYDLGQAKGLRIRVRGDGREYGLNAVCTDERGRRGSWRKRFTAPPGEWAVIDVPLSSMVLNIRGRTYPDVGPPNPDAIRGFSFIIGDKDTSPFQLEIDWIAAY